MTASEGAKKHAAPGDAVHLYRVRGGAPAPMHARLLTIEEDDDGFPVPLSAGDGRHALVAAQEWPATAEAVPWARFGTAPARTEGVPELIAGALGVARTAAPCPCTVPARRGEPLPRTGRAGRAGRIGHGVRAGPRIPCPNSGHGRMTSTVTPNE